MTTLRQSKEVQRKQQQLNAEIQEHGAPCDGYTEEFFAEPENRLALQMAKFICDTCPIQRTCLDYALEAKEEFGIWGGMTPEERKYIYDNEKRILRRERYLREKGNPRQ